MYCRNCGHEVNENDKFCANCGAMIVKDEEAVAISKENETDNKPAKKEQAAVFGWNTDTTFGREPKKHSAGQSVNFDWKTDTGEFRKRPMGDEVAFAPEPDKPKEEFRGFKTEETLKREQETAAKEEKKAADAAAAEAAALAEQRKAAEEIAAEERAAAEKRAAAAAEEEQARKAAEEAEMKRRLELEAKAKIEAERKAAEEAERAAAERQEAAAEARKKAAEEARAAEEAKKAEEARAAEEAKKAEEARAAEEAGSKDSMMIHGIPVERRDDDIKGEDLEKAIFGDIEESKKADGNIDKFYTFNQKNEEFQKLLDREYEKFSNGRTVIDDDEFAKSAAAYTAETEEAKPEVDDGMEKVTGQAAEMAKAREVFFADDMDDELGISDEAKASEPDKDEEDDGPKHVAKRHKADTAPVEKQEIQSGATDDTIMFMGLEAAGIAAAAELPDMEQDKGSEAEEAGSEIEQEAELEQEAEPEPEADIFKKFSPKKKMSGTVSTSSNDLSFDAAQPDQVISDIEPPDEVDEPEPEEAQAEEPEPEIKAEEPEEARADEPEAEVSEPETEIESDKETEAEEPEDESEDETKADEPETEPEEERRMSRGGKIAVTILIIVIALEVAFLGIKFIASDSAISNKIDSVTDKVIMMVKGDGSSGSTGSAYQSAVIYHTDA